MCCSSVVNYYMADQEESGISRMLLNIVISILVLVLGAWATETQMSISNLRQTSVETTVHLAQQHEGQALLGQQLKIIEDQIQELKDLMEEHMRLEHAKE